MIVERLDDEQWTTKSSKNLPSGLSAKIQAQELNCRMTWSETNIIYAIIGSVGVLSTVVIWLRANTITRKYYASPRYNTPSRIRSEDDQ